MGSLSALLFILCFYFFLSHFQFIFIFYFSFFRSLKVWCDWCTLGAQFLSLLPIELFRATPPSSWVHQHHSASLCTTLHQCKMCTAHPSFVHPRIVELCINAKTFAHGASILQCTLCTDDINVQCDEQIVPVFWFHVFRFKWTVYSTRAGESASWLHRRWEPSKGPVSRSISGFFPQRNWGVLPPPLTEKIR